MIRWPNQIFIYILIINLFGCSATTLTKRNEALWFYPESHQPKSVIIMIHGLNLRPSAMYNLAHRLSLHGHLVRVIALPGHDGVELKNCQANIQLFEQSLLAELSEITQYASAHKVPLYGIGFSLGGLMLQNPMIQEKIEKQVLLAPALFPNWYVNLMRATAYLPNCLAFPSRNQENLKANTKTVSGLYQTLFELIDKYQPTNKLETLLVLDQKDSLINFAKTINFYPEKKNLVVVDSKLSDHHLIIDESALGKEQWESLIDQIVTFLAKPAENNTERQ